MNLYPLIFIPLCSYRIWGGNKLKTVLHKKYSEESIGESWEISDVANNETFVRDGFLKGKSLKELIQIFKSDFLGEKVYKAFGEDFPLLIKFIDADKPLSIQVHPTNELARKRHNSFGKNEMWYVMEAEQDAELVVGFNQNVSKETYVKHLNANLLDEILNIEKVTNGDAFYIPTGRVHAIGAGVLLAEIQQTSNITYRIYDYDRVDKTTGKKRELHTDLALDAIDFKYYDTYKTSYTTNYNQPNELVNSPYFKTNIIQLTTRLKRDLKPYDSFVIYMCVAGEVLIEVLETKKQYQLKIGQTIIIPACITDILLQSTQAKLIEVHM